MSLIEHRRWQADTIEKHNPPTVGEWNWPQMLRDDADEIERLRAVNEDAEQRLANMDKVVLANIESGKRIRAENERLRAELDEMERMTRNCKGAVVIAKEWIAERDAEIERLQARVEELEGVIDRALY